MRAIDLANGRTLWQDDLSAGGQAIPMPNEANGRQFVAIMAGGHYCIETRIGDELIAYARPAR
jgi:quinoprotein glucose dehydrogenase